MTFGSGVKQKIKGKAQKAKAEYDDVMGNKGGAVINRIKGETNETIADLKLKRQQKTNYNNDEQ